jgi:hypothetical protein
MDTEKPSYTIFKPCHGHFTHCFMQFLNWKSKEFEGNKCHVLTLFGSYRKLDEIHAEWYCRLIVQSQRFDPAFLSQTIPYEINCVWK